MLLRFSYTIPALALLLMVGVAQFGAQKLQDRFESVKPTPAAAQAGPSYFATAIHPSIVKRLLGLRLLVADLLWIDTLVQVEPTKSTEQLSTFFWSFKTITALDPDNLYAYVIAGLYLSVIKDDIRGATAILRDGTNWMKDHPFSWPGAWQLPFTLGYNMIFEEHEFEEGGRWIAEAAKMPNAPEYVVALGRRAATEAGRLELGSRVLVNLYKKLSKPEERTAIEKKLSAITVRQQLLEINEKFQHFIESTGAYAFPKSRQFELFMQSGGVSRTDILGRSLFINSAGKVVSE